MDHPTPRIGIDPATMTPYTQMVGRGTRSDEVEVGLDQPTMKRKPVMDPATKVVSGVPGSTLVVRPKLILAGTQAEPARIMDVRGEEVSSLTWPKYLAWRKSKCRPYDYEREPRIVQDMSLPHHVRGRALEEIDQAIHEFVGEVAELGELIEENGPLAYYGDLRLKLIDECGDVFFCAMWALDSWGSNPFYDDEADLELLRINDEDGLALLAKVVGMHPYEVTAGQAPQYIQLLGSVTYGQLVVALTNAGLLCNSYKKLRYQRREQSVDKQVARILETLHAVNQILIIANSSVEEALLSNIRKLDARFPDGYKPGVGGGIREGAGA